MRERLAIFCLIFAAGYAYVEASAVKTTPAVANVTPTPPENVGSSDLGSPGLGSPDAKPAWLSCTYRVRQSQANNSYYGTAVSLGRGLLVTAAHNLPGATTPEVYVNGKWVPAGFSRVQGQDVAYLTIADQSLPGVPVSRPAEGDAVTVYGTTTRIPWHGTLTGVRSKDGMWQVRLDTDLAGTETGDSGGGVFSDDGALLLVHARHSQTDRRITWGTPLNPPTPYASPQPAVTATPPAASSYVCNGATCSPVTVKRGLFRK